jgi:cholesterol oxidase
MRTLSNDIEEIKPHYTIVVIGSGYGGAIAASRLSRAGQQVCVLERGKEFMPGDFPENLLEAAGQMQIHSPKEHIGSKTGLFDFHIHPGISVLVGCGLGGTSLINANVAMKPEDRVFLDPRWPAPIREEFGRPDSLLNKGFQLAVDMLKSKPLPNEIELDKLKSLKASADAHNQSFYRTNVNVNFDVDGPNHVGVEQKPCVLCGDCCSGCNHQAKNTTQMNYLPDAKNHGAEIYTEVGVDYVEKKDGKYHIHFKVMGAGTDKFQEADPFITADIIVLAAGTLGSTEILLRSKEKGLAISDQAGNHFSGNGDVLGFGYNTDHEVNGLGFGAIRPEKKSAAGPCITGVIDLRNQPDLEDGMVIEDAAIPGALGAALPLTLAIEAKKIGVTEEESKTFLEDVRHKERALASEVRGPYFGAIKNTQTYLVMSHDNDKGKFVLENDRLTINWNNVGREQIFFKIDEQLKRATKALDGIYVKNPVWIQQMNNELVTVHPLGGCFMGEQIETGVVNHKGQLFSKDDPSGVYQDFYVTDGSVIPRSLGTNPLLTISAVSERCCALMAEDHGWTIDYSMDKPPMTTDDKPRPIGVEFTETMKGFFSKTVKDGNYQKGFDDGMSAGESFEFTLTIRTQNAKDMINNPEHEAKMIGSIRAPGLSATPLTAINGVFNLFVDDPDTVDTKLMKYRMKLIAEDGKTYYFKGFKFVHHNKGLDMWPETSTLYITLFDGADDTAPVYGQGILHILPSDFEKQMTTMKAVNAPSQLEGLRVVADFGKYFARELFDVYGGVFAPDILFNPSVPRKKRTLRLSTPEFHSFKTADGVDLLLTRYNGTKDGIQKLPLMMVHGFSGNRLTFAIDTIDTNMAEYFYAHGYDVWLLDYRLSNLLASSTGQHTVDEVAQYDYPAAIEKIRQVSGAEAVDVMAHCVGSISIFMAMMNGLKGVRSIVSAQIASDFYASKYTQWKATLHVADILSFFGVKSLTAYTDVHAGWTSRLYNRFLKFFAVPQAGYCNDPTCHRMTFMFGPLYEHSQLNDATHAAMIEMFTVANMRTYKQLTRMMRARKLLDAQGKDIYMPHLDRLKLPITFIHGEMNHVFDPKSTLTTYNNLCNANGTQFYKRHVIPGYGHNDCMYGKNAVVDVFPLIREQFEVFYK